MSRHFEDQEGLCEDVDIEERNHLFLTKLCWNQRILKFR